MIRTLLLLTAMTALTPLAAPVAAQSYLPDGYAKSGKKSAREVFAKLRELYGGEQLGFEEKRKGRKAEYHIDWLSRDGRKMRIVVDAHSGDILKTTGG